MTRAIWLSLLVALACGPTVVRKGQKLRLVPTGDLARLAETIQGRKCASADEKASGRGDGDVCGPFPCEGGECRVIACGGSEDPGCHLGFCFEGFCVRAAEHGQRSCEPFAWLQGDDEKVDWSRFNGCKCTPQGETVGRDEPRCGDFPCTADGCYVSACKVDKDCAHGLCSSHASGPQGYCVTDDPI
ncbi:MAG: hypothetical protein JNK04_14690 [Myxococcales bacterium]|nr:hypothetical protein [Myxococcales bacterium]